MECGVDLDIADLVILEFDPANLRPYRVGSGWRDLERSSEFIRVRGGTNVEVVVEETLWGLAPAARPVGSARAVPGSVDARFRADILRGMSQPSNRLEDFHEC